MDNNSAIIPGFDNDKDDSLTISLRKAEGVPHGMFIYLSGYIDTYNSSFFQKQIQKVMDAGFINLIFNCSSLNYVSSTGIGSFTVFLKVVKPKGGDVILLEIQPKVYEYSSFWDSLSSSILRALQMRLSLTLIMVVVIQVLLYSH